MNLYTKNILEKTRDIVQQGWTQGDYENKGCYCLAGAVFRALGYINPQAASTADDEDKHEVFALFTEPLIKRGHCPRRVMARKTENGTWETVPSDVAGEQSIVEYNDNVETTKELVLALIDEVLGATAE